MDSMINHSPLQVPVDIWDNVFTNLCDDISSLKSCSLVWSTWLPPTYRQLHRRLRLRAVHTDKAASRRSCPEIPPRILPYVRLLDLEYRNSRHSNASPWWGPLLSTLKLDDVQALRLRRLNWGSISDSMQVAILALLRSPSLRTLSLSECHLPSSLSLRNLCNLNIVDLRLDRVNIYNVKDRSSPMPGIAGDPHVVSTELKVLKICIDGKDSAMRLVDWVVHSQILPDLHALELYCARNDEAMPLLKPLFRSCTAIETLTVMGCSEVDALLADAYRCTSLEYLHITPYRMYPPMIQFNSPPSLRRICIDLVICMRWSLSGLIMSDLVDLNQKWGRGRQFTAIEEVKLQLCFHDETGYFQTYEMLPNPLKVVPKNGDRSILVLTPNDHIAFDTLDTYMWM